MRMPIHRCEVLKVLTGQPEQYLPIVSVFLDDITADGINPWTGVLLAGQRVQSARGEPEDFSIHFASFEAHF
jgi:hypothetical protein